MSAQPFLYHYQKMCNFSLSRDGQAVIHSSLSTWSKRQDWNFYPKKDVIIMDIVP